MRSLNFEQFLAEEGVSDPFVDVLALGSPSGSMSNRARTAARTRLGAAQVRYREAMERFQAAVDRGEVEDPTGRYRRREPAPVSTAQVDRRIADFENMLRHRPRSRKYRAALEEARREREQLLSGGVE